MASKSVAQLENQSQAADVRFEIDRNGPLVLPRKRSREGLVGLANLFPPSLGVLYYTCETPITDYTFLLLVFEFSLTMCISDLSTEVVTAGLMKRTGSPSKPKFRREGHILG